MHVYDEFDIKLGDWKQEDFCSQKKIGIKVNSLNELDFYCDPTFKYAKKCKREHCKFWCYKYRKAKKLQTFLVLA